MSQLLIRPSHNDHHVIETLLAPGGARRITGGPAIGGLVLDATTAAARPAFAEAAGDAGIQVVVDPMTFLLQKPVNPEDSFARLPFGHLAGTRPEDLDLDALVDLVLEFELEKGASVLVPPYFHVTDVEGAWAQLNLELLQRSAERAETNGIGLAALTVMSGGRRDLANRAGGAYIDRYVERASETGATVGVCTSPSGGKADSYGSISKTMSITAKVSGRLPTIAWRQGIYGEALVVAGASGYECGIGMREVTDIAGAQNSRKPKTSSGDEGDGSNGGATAGVFLPGLGRSIKKPLAEHLLTVPALQAELICSTPGCCDTVIATTKDNRGHSVRTRSYLLSELDRQPSQWRLQHLIRRTQSAIGTSQRANDALASSGETYRVPVKPLSELELVLQHMAAEAKAS